MSAHVLYRIPSVEVPERRHPLEHTVLWQVRGYTEITCDENTVTLREGEAAWIPRGSPHTLRVGVNSITSPLSIDATQLHTTLDNFAVVRVTQEDKLFLLALWNSQSSVIRPDADLGRQVVAIIENATTRSELRMPLTPEVAAVARAISLDPTNASRISEWAEQACMSGRSLERAFAAETGLSFGQWRKTCRLLIAARLLRSGTPVQEVSHRVGYESPSSFSRAFRAFHGKRPSDFASGV